MVEGSVMICGTIVRTTASVACALLWVSGCADKSAPTAANATPTTQHVEQIKADQIKTEQTKSVRAYLDPVTGQLRDPTPEELAAEAAQQAQKKQAAAATDTARPVRREVVLPNGAIEVTLDPSAQHALLACIGKDGSVKMDHECTEHSEPGAKR